MAKFHFILATFVLRFFAEHVNGVSIQFYTDYNFTDLFYESNSTAKCNNFPAEKQNEYINSIKTDTCLLVYYHPDCRPGSRKFDPDNRWGWGYSISSFHICNEDVGGPRLNVDITQWYNIFNKPNEIPDVIESYRNVCDCINVPKYVQNLTEWSINNYGNDIIGYYEPNCLENQWKSVLIPGGHWESADMNFYYVKTNRTTNTKYKIQSLGPDTKSKYLNISCSHDETTETSVSQVKNQSKFSSVVTKVTGVVDNVLDMANETKQNDTLESLIVRFHIHDLEVAKKFSKIEQDNRNLSRQVLESETRLRKIEAKIQQQQDELQNLTLKIKNDLRQIFA